MLLNVGSGDLRAPVPWVNVDSHEGDGVTPDILADARDLKPIADGEADAVFAGHLLEHLSYGWGVPAVLREFRRVLRPGGRLGIVGPDYTRALAADPVDDVLLEVIRNGGGRWKGDLHLWVSTAALTLAEVRRTFPDAREVPVGELDAFWPIHSRVGWQFAITATKEA